MSANVYGADSPCHTCEPPKRCPDPNCHDSCDAYREFLKLVEATRNNEKRINEGRANAKSLRFGKR